MKIDVFNHVLPAGYLERMHGFAPADVLKGFASVRTLIDIDARLRMLEPFDDYQQVLSLSLPAIEEFAGPDDSPELARLANDGLAAFCKAHPDRFIGFIASMPMNNPAAALVEIDRAMGELGACGIQVLANVNGRPLDEPEFYPIFERMAELNRPIWLHPTRPPSHADYAGEDRSYYEIWWALGWAYETSAAMARLVFSGVMEKLPDLKIICHHWGAYIPHAEGRMMPLWQEGIANSAEDTGSGPKWDNLARPLTEYFKMFYGDTALFGGRAASQCGLDFFGAGHSLFATDCPYDTMDGALNIRRTIKVIDSLRCSDEDRRMIYETNLRSMIGQA